MLSALVSVDAGGGVEAEEFAGWARSGTGAVAGGDVCGCRTGVCVPGGDVDVDVDAVGVGVDVDVDVDLDAVSWPQPSELHAAAAIATATHPVVAFMGISMRVDAS